MMMTFRSIQRKVAQRKEEKLIEMRMERLKKKEAKSAKWMEIRARTALEKRNKIVNIEMDEAKIEMNDLFLMEDAMKCLKLYFSEGMETDDDKESDENIMRRLPLMNITMMWRW